MSNKFISKNGFVYKSFIKKFIKEKSLLSLEKKSNL